MNKTEYFKTLSQVQEILAANQLQNVAAGEIAEIRRDMQEYVCRIPVIGGFSAGKSAFLNALLDRRLLEEAQVPETAIATELVYDTDEHIEAVAEDGRSRRFDIGSAAAIDPDTWMYLVYHVNSPYLRDNPEIILVDMPGLDSNLERHNRAISRYIGRASAYILLVSCEDGTIRNSARSFLREAEPYDRALYCFVSKTDLRSEENVQSVVQSVQNVVRSSYGDGTPVVPISSVEDPEFRRKTDAVLNFFDPDQLFALHFAPALLGIIDAALVALSNSQKALTLDTNQIDERIRDSQTNYEKLTRQLEAEKRKLVQTNRNRLTPDIIRNLEDALSSQAESLADALMVSPEAFSSTATSIIRRTLRDADYYIESSYEDIVEQLDLSFIAEEDLITDAVMLDAQNLTASTIDTERSLRGRGIYQAITGVLAIVTDIVNPLIELAIVLFPSIIGLFENKQKEKERERLIDQVRHSIAPQIATRLRPEVERIMDNAMRSMIARLEKHIGQLLQAEEVALKQAKNDKTQQETELGTAKAKLQADMSRLNELRTTVSDRVNRV